MRKAVVMPMALLAACAAPAPRPLSLAESGPVEVTRGGQSYVADVQPLVGGQSLAITREGLGFRYDEGLEAKRVAEVFCDGRGRRLAAGSLGRFSAGAWVFDGACG